MIFRSLLLVLAGGLSACSALEKDNAPKEPVTVAESVKDRVEIYRHSVAADSPSGPVVLDGSIGDSALFSCLARVGGATDVDPALFFVGGKPVRHPDIHPNFLPDGSKWAGGSDTPISRDMVQGLLWCLYDLDRKGDRDHAAELVAAMIAFGKDHKEVVGQEIGWNYCTAEDRSIYKISDEDWFGKCWMTPSTVKDIYRMAVKFGLDCDADCKKYMVLGFNIPSNKKGFERHLAVLSTVRNGLVDGAINDNSLKEVLQKAAADEPRNGLYLAAYHTFGDGDQSSTWAALDVEGIFPREHAPTDANYCTDYLFQRDDDSLSGREKPDWLPCGDGSAGAEGRGIEFLFAYALASGEAR